MGKLINMIGQKFGRLTVIKRSYPNAKNKDVRWLCKCNCGTEKIVLGKSLRRGTKSCGCLQKETAGNQNRLKPGLAGMRAVIVGYRLKAKKKGLKYSLTEEEFAEITKKDCHYCGAKPSNKNKSYIYNGLDRKNNLEGYTINNVASCCKHCNIAKNNMTLQEFKNWIERVYNKTIGGKL